MVGWKGHKNQRGDLVQMTCHQVEIYREHDGCLLKNPLAVNHHWLVEPEILHIINYNNRFQKNLKIPLQIETNQSCDMLEKTQTNVNPKPKSKSEQSA